MDASAPSPAATASSPTDPDRPSDGAAATCRPPFAALRPWQGRWPSLGLRVYLDPAAVVIGRVWLGDDASVWPGAVIRGDVHDIRVGARTSVQDLACLHVTHDGPFSPGGRALDIGDDVTVGHGAILHACTVGDRVLVGMRATVLDGAVIAADTMLGAGSLVPPGKHLPGGFLYVGSPAAPVRPLTERELAFLRYSAENYVRVKDEHRRLNPPQPP